MNPQSVNATAPRLGLVVRALIAILAATGMIWSGYSFGSGALTDSFRGIEARLLQFESYSLKTATRTLDSEIAGELSACETHAQRALTLLELPVAEAALRSGATRDYDDRLRSIERRTRGALGCAPRQAFEWLVLFGIETAHGVLEPQTFALLANSYAYGPLDAWVGIRRMAVAIPLLLSLPDPLKARVLREFQDLVRGRFVEYPAAAYSGAPAPIRVLLDQQLNALEEPAQRYFRETLSKLRS